MFSWNWLKENQADEEMINSPRDNDLCRDLEGWTVSKYIDYLLTDPEGKFKPNITY
jgi:hypothetical protein